MSVLLDVADASVSLAGRVIVTVPRLTLRAGEVVTLEGASGAGKTTLLRGLAGLLPMRGWAPPPGAGAALVFQEHALARRLSARRNVLVGALGRLGFWRPALGLWPGGEREAADAVLARVGLAGLGDMRADRLSGGQRQRVGIARALLTRRRILLADEPVASLDPLTARAILDLLRSLAAAEGLAVLVSLHQPDLAARIADRRHRVAGGVLEETP